MKRRTPLVSLAVLVTVVTSLAAPLRAQPGDLLARMAALNSALHSYTAEVHADVALRAVIPLNPSLDGTYYHKEPGRNKIVFTGGLPMIAKQFSKVYPNVASPSEWPQLYDISTESDDGTYTILKLVPRKHGRVDHIDAKVNDALATVVQLRWTYNDGGYALLNQTYRKVHGYQLVVRQVGKVEVPHYSADVTSTFSDFKLNVPIPDSVFQQN